MAHNKEQYNKPDPRKDVDIPPAAKTIEAMAKRATAGRDPRKEPSKPTPTERSPIGILHRVGGKLPPEIYLQQLQKMITASVINTYATFAELIVEKRGDTTKAAYRRRVPGKPYEVSAEDRDERGAFVVPARGSRKAKKTAAQLRARSAVEKTETEAGHISKEYMENEPFAEAMPKSQDKNWRNKRSPKGHAYLSSREGPSHPKMQETRPMRAKRRRGERAAEIQHRKENKAALAKKKALESMRGQGRKGTRGNVVSPQETNEGIMDLGKKFKNWWERKKAASTKANEMMTKQELADRAGNQGPPAIKVVEDPKRNNGN